MRDQYVDRLDPDKGHDDAAEAIDREIVSQQHRRRQGLVLHSS